MTSFLLVSTFSLLFTACSSHQLSFDFFQRPAIFSPLALLSSSAVSLAHKGFRTLCIVYIYIYIQVRLSFHMRESSASEIPISLCYIYISEIAISLCYIYIYMCVCVCVRACARGSLWTRLGALENALIIIYLFIDSVPIASCQDRVSVHQTA